MVNEANNMSKFMQRNVYFEIYIASIEEIGKKWPLSEIKIKVTNYEMGWVNDWSVYKFENRVLVMRKMVRVFLSTNIVEYKGKTELDPYYDPR